MSDPDAICTMHNSFLIGMFESVFDNVEIIELEICFHNVNFVLIKQSITK